MRVKNDSKFIPICIMSCIDALDELIIVYNDCTDNSEEIINTYQERYPQKIKAYKYPYNVLSQGLSKAEFERAMSLPDDSPHLLCNYYNFALEKVCFTHAVKIDADQIYFHKEISKWRDLAKLKSVDISFSERIIGWLVFNVFRVFRLISIKTGRCLGIPFRKVLNKSYNIYKKYVEYCFVTKDSCPSLSGINLYIDEANYVTLGYVSDNYNILPPFNGEGDHLVFKVSEDTYYKKFVFNFYNKLRSSTYSIIEIFQHPYTVMPYGFCWFHINSMRDEYRKKNQTSFQNNPEKYMELKSFLNKNFREILSLTDKEMFSLYQRILFQFLFENDKRTVLDNLTLIDTINLC